jgi:hypothetical protein
MHRQTGEHTQFLHGGALHYDWLFDRDCGVTLIRFESVPPLRR